ncbi:glycosyl transferase family 2 [Lysobacter xanthus]
MDRTAIAAVVPAGPGDEAWHSLLPVLVASGVAECVLVLPDRVQPSAPVPTGVRVLHAPRGRAAQLNAGAAATHAPVLWFLHADTGIDARVLAGLDRHLLNGAPGLGYFDLAFASDGPALARLNGWGATLRSRLLRLPFGDQAFVIGRHDFVRLGGFPSVDGEDHAFVWSARGAGLRLRALGGTVITSARKYGTRGWWTTTRQHWSATLRQSWAFSRGEQRP